MADEKDTPFSPIENKVMDALEEVIDPEFMMLRLMIMVNVRSQ